MGTRRLRWSAAMSLAAILSHAPAAMAQEKSESPAPPFWGKVSAERVNIRMSPNKEGIIVRTAKEDESVLVVGREGGWYQVTAPEGAWCWIRTSAIKKSPEGEAVAKQDTALRIDSRSNAPELGVIGKGEPVKVLLEKGEWAKIQAPPSVPFYVNDDFVAFDRAYDPAKDPAIVVGKKPGDAAPVATVDAAPRKPTATEVQAELDAVKAQYERIQKEHKAAIDQLIATQRGPEPFDAEGVLDTLGLYIGRPGTHALVKGGKVICYLKSGDPGKINLNSYYNQHVGVRGKAESVEGVALMRVITVTEIRPVLPQ